MHMEMETPKNWIHIFHGYGEEGEAIGSFIFPNGRLKYDYGIFANPLQKDSDFIFRRDSLIANRFKIFIGYDENNKLIGIHIPKQDEMEWPLSFYTSTNNNNFQDIINAIKRMKFKKLYGTGSEIISCSHDDLSTQFSFITSLTRVTSDSCIVSIIIIDKTSGLEHQQITYSSIFLHDTTFKDCNFARSYSTHKNDTLAAYDNLFGDMIIADFNFDGKEDFAIIKESGGNGGPLNNFFVQNADSKFILDKFLSDSVEFYPSKIDKNKRTITTYVHAGACLISENIFSYNSKTKNWRIKGRKLIDVCNQ